ncbi:MAG: 50S ribosomal protein L11 methyltransferase [Syntrophales bacterium]|nr:50S ribosomal protein L11 methyltransferase [Syntrophales bacterium]
MRIAVVHTAGAPCGCAEAVAKGLHALGHDVVFVDSAEIELKVGEISRSCDLVIDHTDTFRGTGLLRPFVRGLLEASGARIVGSDAGACFRADDKIAAKTCLASAGIAVPPGVAVTSKKQKMPGWLKAPVILKPAFEHMSRGLHVVATDEEIHERIAALLDRFMQPILVETFIPGREFAVSLLEEENGLSVLPPLEWRVHPGEAAVLTEAFKRSYVTKERQDVFRAELPPELAADLENLSILAFRTLGLRDYARFDIRLSIGGTFYFLEANTTPSLEPLEALALSARWAGWDYPALVEKMLSAALRRYGRHPLHRDENMNIMLPTGPVDLRIPAGVHHPPPSTLELAARLDVQEGDRVLDLGCGAGLLAIAAARLGAGHVVAADIDPRALEATRQNALANGVADKIEICAGAWYEALNGRSAGDAGLFDVIVATPPQVPGHHAFGPRYGGPDGTRHLFKILQGAAVFLKPESGRLWLMAISLANPSELLRELRERFHHVCIVHETERFFTGDEYESIETGLMNHFLALRSSGSSDFSEAGEGGYRFRNLFICAREVKTR